MPVLLGAEHLIDHVLMKQIQLRLVAEKAGLVDREIFQQLGQFVFSLAADQQAIIAVERIQMALFEPALQPVLEEVGAARIEMHAALLIDERLQQLQFRFRKLHLHTRAGHELMSDLPPCYLDAAVPRASVALVFVLTSVLLSALTSLLASPGFPFPG